MKNLIIILLLVMTITNYSQSQFQFAGNINTAKAESNSVEFQLSNCLLNIYIIDQNIIRFRYTNRKEFSKSPSYAVIYQQPEKPKFEFKEEKDKFVLTTNELTVHIQKNPCRISTYDKQMNLLNADEESFGVSFDNDEVRCHKKLFTDERFFGLGEKANESLIKNGEQYTMWNTDYYGYTGRQEPIYVSIPFFMGLRDYKAYGIFFDNTYKSYFNMGASNNRFYWFGADNGEMDYYFIYGPEFKRVISDYTKLTGRMELPPMWALGYQQSRWSYYPESTVRSIAKNFRSKNIPCDVIYLDIHYMDGYRVFTWDKTRFPNPPQMLSDLKKDGFKIIPIIDPGVKADPNYFAAQEGLQNDLFVKYPDGIPYQGEVWPSWAYFPDFTKKETRDWWGEKLSVFLNQGVEGFWNDMNEPAVWGGGNVPDIVQYYDNGLMSNHKKIKNVYALEMARATRNGLKKFSEQRHFILSRAGFAGIQRYSANWTGDNVSSDEHLRLACVMPQNVGLSGQPFIGSDVGGFMGGEPTNEMYIRWMQLGAFTPFFRGHSAIDTKSREPFAFNETVEEFSRQAIQLRYRLIPFWYNEFYNSARTGLPIMRSMFVNYQNDENCYSRNAQYQFMIGENLLVAPVVNSTESTKRLYLPEGKWYDWINNKIVNGGEWKIFEVPLNKIALYIKEGGMIPMQEVQNYIGEKKIEQLELVICPSQKSEYTLYEDDGLSYKYETGKYSLTKFSLEKDAKVTKLQVAKLKADFKNDRKKYLFTLLDTKLPKKVFLNNKELPNSAVSFDKEKNIIHIAVNDTDNFNIQLEY
ncbi:MAG: glycoside hydrolase family 31 protein [Melioribacter sp.]|nr:glycoside hydrolase family 31 protein [Melioribacter sp.]